MLRDRDVRRRRVDHSRNQPGVSALGNRTGVPSQRRQRAHTVGTAIALGRAGCTPAGHARSYYVRWAISFAPIMLGLFAVKSLGDQAADRDLPRHQRPRLGAVRRLRRARRARTRRPVDRSPTLPSSAPLDVVARCGQPSGFQTSSLRRWPCILFALLAQTCAMPVADPRKRVDLGTGARPCHWG